ncbi:hypothetical protein EIP86_006275 [Pleurotus ostreatoroseus]|nr:hypothetical protein EIP86_006275 [Pleurotus ostreatoroseus]
MSPLPNVLFLEILDYLAEDIPSLRSCSQVSKALCDISSWHMFTRVKYVADSCEFSIASLFGTSQRGRFRRTKELTLKLRKNAPAMGRRSTDGNENKEGDQETTAKRIGGARDIAFRDPNAPPVPPQGHINMQALYQLLKNLPKLEALRISCLHVTPGPTFHIAPFASIRELRFEGVDTGNAFYCLLPLWQRIETLTISDHWEETVLPAGPAHLPDTFPYHTGGQPGVERKLQIGSLKISALKPQVLHYWTKAVQHFVDTKSASIDSLTIPDTLFVFQDGCPITDAAIAEIIGCIRHITLDLSANNSIYFGEGRKSVLLPSLHLAHFLETMTIRCCVNKNSLRATTSFIKSTISTQGRRKIPPPSLHRINLKCVFKRRTDELGDIETLENVVQRFKKQKWPVLIPAAKALRWLSHGVGNGKGTVHVEAYDEVEEKGGKVWLQDLLKEQFIFDWMSGWFFID